MICCYCGTTFDAPAQPRTTCSRDCFARWSWFGGRPEHVRDRITRTKARATPRPVADQPAAETAA